MESIQVTPSNLRKVAGEVDELANKYKTQYDGLFKIVENFTSTDFQGEDAKKFCAKVREFEDDFTNMKTLMNE